MNLQLSTIALGVKDIVEGEHQVAEPVAKAKQGRAAILGRRKKLNGRLLRPLQRSRWLHLESVRLLAAV